MQIKTGEGEAKEYVRSPARAKSHKFQFAQEFTMAEINKLSVGKALEKLRSADAPKASKIEQLDEKSRTLDEEILRLRAARRRLKRGQPPGMSET